LYKSLFTNTILLENKPFFFQRDVINSPPKYTEKFSSQIRTPTPAPTPTPTLWAPKPRPRGGVWFWVSIKIAWGPKYYSILCDKIQFTHSMGENVVFYFFWITGRKNMVFFFWRRKKKQIIICFENLYQHHMFVT